MELILCVERQIIVTLYLVLTWLRRLAGEQKYFSTALRWRSNARISIIYDLHTTQFLAQQISQFGNTAIFGNLMAAFDDIDNAIRNIKRFVRENEIAIFLMRQHSHFHIERPAIDNTTNGCIRISEFQTFVRR